MAAQYSRGVTSRARSRDQQGAAALEFALVVIPLVALIMGIVTFGLGYSNHIALTNAVREGARLGASTPSTSNWADAVVTQTVNVYADANNPITSANVCALLISKTGGATPVYATKQKSSVACDSPAGSAGAGAPPATPTSIPDGCFVKVWARRPVNVNWILGSATISLYGQSVSLYDRTLCS